METQFYTEFDKITPETGLVFSAIRGSQCHGISTPQSDVDTYGIFIGPEEWLYGSGKDYTPQVSDEKNDNIVNEIGKFIKELMKSNPNALEALYIRQDLVKYYDPILDPLWKNKDAWVTKECFLSFGGYATSQLKKMAGLKKAMNTDPDEVKERKSLLWFSWVPRLNSDGVWSLEKWLRENGLSQERCGLVRCANGDNLYQLYYDWAADLNLTWEDCKRINKSLRGNEELGMTEEEFNSRRARGFIEYRGILDPHNETTQPRLSPISKKLSPYPLCSFQFNQNALTCHCQKYKAYWDWVEHRNPERFQLNVGYNYDAKNGCEMIRLLTMAKEIALGQGFNLDRSIMGDREYLLSIKRHEITYDDLLKKAKTLESEMNAAFEKSTLPELPDQEALEEILIQIRKNYYGRR